MRCLKNELHTAQPCHYYLIVIICILQRFEIEVNFTEVNTDAPLHGEVLLEGTLQWICFSLYLIDATKLSRNKSDFKIRNPFEIRGIDHRWVAGMSGYEIS